MNSEPNSFDTRAFSLLRRVKDLSATEFVCLLDFIAVEFQQFLRAIEPINNEALEKMLDSVLEAINIKMGQIIQAEHTTIFLVDYDNKQLWARTVQENAYRPVEIRIPITVGIPGHVASTGQSLNISDISTHHLFSPELEKQMGYRIKNILCMPVIGSKNQIVAVMQLVNKAGNTPFDQEDEQQFSNFAESIGITLESCQSFYVAARNQRGITNLTGATEKLGVLPSSDATFFTEWKAPLPTLTDAEKVRLEHLKQRYLYYADSGAITKGTVNLIVLSPLLETLGFFDPPYQVRSEKYIQFEIEDGDTQLDGLIDALVVRDAIWLIVIESKRYGFSVQQAIGQTLAYMLRAPISPVFALITTGEDYLFIKLDRDLAQYALSDKFTLSTASGNELYSVAQILKRLVGT
ncbi:hypothetical protein CAL7716_082680 [Calothrix sp. PCC 7716]|nr:hypothetical protein CAL7716_082680 [Calothrix sp. PCC 7716]